MLEYLRTRSAELGLDGIRERVRAALAELDKAVEAVREADIRRRPVEGKWNIAEVVDHIAQTQIRSAERTAALIPRTSPSRAAGLRSFTIGLSGMGVVE
jgi:hypothetical protein